MSKYFFDLIVDGDVDVWTEELVDAVMGATETEGDPGVTTGIPSVICSGDFPTIRDAIKTRIAQVESCGLKVVEVKLFDGEKSEDVEAINLVLRLKKLVEDKNKLVTLWQDFAQAS
jgi:hypothetical protein